MHFAALLSALIFASVSTASPTQSLVVFNPRITSPKASITWHMGTSHNVTWETSSIPAQKRASTGLILLGHHENGSMNLDINHPLASGFPITAGFATVTMPKNVQARSDYFIVLFGDSGNTSPKFKITRL